MTARLIQDQIEVRKELNRVNNLGSASKKNVEDFVEFPNFYGRNYLVNGHKGISQRGDYTTPVTAVDDTYYIDRFAVALSTIAADFSHVQTLTDNNAWAIRMECTSTGTGNMGHYQEIENGAAFRNRDMTYTAEVRSNHEVRVRISDGVTSAYSDTHPGDGQWHTMSVTKKIDPACTNLKVFVTNWHEANMYVIDGDWYEAGFEQIEMGDKFTHFEPVNSSIEYDRCRRYYQEHSIQGTILRSTSTQQYIPISISPMRAAPTVTSDTFQDDDSSGLTNADVIVSGSTMIRYITFGGTITAGSRFSLNIYLDAEL